MKPRISIVIPTLNAERTLSMCLEAIRAQKIDQASLEIWIVDAGSTDDTLSIAKKYQCKVVHNPEKQPEYAKYIGLSQATGRYLMFIDSDQILQNTDSLAMRLQILKQNPKLKHLIGSGLLTPEHAPRVNLYINSAGDPFSYYMYDLSSDDHMMSLFRRYPVIQNEKKFFVISLGQGEILPLIDAGGYLLDLDHLKKIDPHYKKDSSIIGNLFERLAKDSSSLVVTKNDFVGHDSVADMRSYLNKLKWRALINIHHPSMSQGFIKRAPSLSFKYKLKKHLFPLYCLSVIYPLIDSIRLCWQKKNMVYLLHLPFTCYVLWQIVYHYLLKFLKVKPRLNSYGSR